MRSALGIAALVFCFTACSYFGTNPGPYRPPGLAHPPGAETGRQLYLRDCAWCHGNRGEGTPRAPDLRSGTNGAALTDFELRTGRMPISDESEPVRRRPPFYDDRQVEEIVSYVASLGGKGPPVASPNPAAGHLGLGERLYQDNCAACHSTTGIGGALTPWPREVPARPHAPGRFVAPSLAQSDAVEIAEAMITGPGPMPVFGREIFDDREIDSVVRYVLSLQDPVDRGGAPIGRVGPVAEGAVAWIVGLGLMVVFVRVIAGRHA